MDNESRFAEEISQREIERLMMRYAILQDEGRLDEVAELFRYGAFIVDKVPVPFRRTAEIAAMKNRHDHKYADGTLRTKHITTNVRITVDEKAGGGHAESYFTVVQATDDLPLQVIMSGRYSDRFKRVDGTWWFEERYVRTDLIGDMSGHVVDNPMVQD